MCILRCISRGLNRMARPKVGTYLIGQFIDLESAFLTECHHSDIRNRLRLSLSCPRFLCKHERIQILLKYCTGQRRFNIMQLSTEIERLRRCEWDPDTYETDIMWRDMAQQNIKVATKYCNHRRERHFHPPVHNLSVLTLC
mgnify:CR=1 FL=1